MLYELVHGGWNLDLLRRVAGWVGPSGYERRERGVSCMVGVWPEMISRNVILIVLAKRPAET